MKYHVLASGSAGNCTVVESGGQFVIIDCGASKRYLKQCFESLKLDPLQARALLVTHAHSDHVKSLSMFRQLPVYAPCELLSLSDEILVEPYEMFTVGPFSIEPLALSHDEPDTVGYILSDGCQRLVSVTDTGYLSQRNAELIRDADYYIFESNYDVAMLMNSDRPFSLKTRIVSDAGHLGNQQAGQALAAAVGPHTKEIVLAHISRECNTRQLAYDSLIETFESYSIDPNRFKITAAGQFEMVDGGE